MLLEFGYFLILRRRVIFSESLRVILMGVINHGISFGQHSIVSLIQKSLNSSRSLLEKVLRMVPKPLRIFRLKSKAKLLPLSSLDRSQFMMNVLVQRITENFDALLIGSIDRDKEFCVSVGSDSPDRAVDLVDSFWSCDRWYIFLARPQEMPRKLE